MILLSFKRKLSVFLTLCICLTTRKPKRCSPANHKILSQTYHYYFLVVADSLNVVIFVVVMRVSVYTKLQVCQLAV